MREESHKRGLSRDRRLPLSRPHFERLPRSRVLSGTAQPEARLCLHTPLSPRSSRGKSTVDLLQLRVPSFRQRSLCCARRCSGIPFWPVQGAWLEQRRAETSPISRFDHPVCAVFESASSMCNLRKALKLGPLSSILSRAPCQCVVLRFRSVALRGRSHCD